LDFIEEKNKETKEYDIVRYNTWENNFFENPFVPLLYSISSLESLFSKIKDSANKLLRSLPKIFIDTAANFTGIAINSHEETQDFFDEFNLYSTELKKIKVMLAEHCKNKKTIILVDELDRCLPEYQIKVLENLHHLFNIPNLIVLIALDRRQLELSIENVFGKNLNVYGYLAKFIDFQIDLPKGDEQSCLLSFMKFEPGVGDATSLKVELYKILKITNMSLRECINVISEINIICNSRGNNNPYWLVLLTAIFSIIKRMDTEIYEQFFSKPIRTETYQKISINDTLYIKFKNKIKGRNISKIIEYIEKDSAYKGFIIYLISWFDNVEKIDMDELLQYTKLTQSRLDNILSNICIADFGIINRYISLLNLNK